MIVLVVDFQQNLKDSRESLKNESNQHEDNLQFLTSRANRLDEAFLDLQGKL